MSHYCNKSDDKMGHVVMTNWLSWNNVIPLNDTLNNAHSLLITSLDEKHRKEGKKK